MTEAQAQNRTRAGVLTCNVSGGIGLIVGSQKSTVCTFNPRRGRNERYVGFIRRFGLDIGATRRGVLAWAVFSGGSVAPGSLAGSYVGGAAEATVGAGLGANVLVGGSNRSIALQPRLRQRPDGPQLRPRRRRPRTARRRGNFTDIAYKATVGREPGRFCMRSR